MTPAPLAAWLLLVAACSREPAPAKQAPATQAPATQAPATEGPASEVTADERAQAAAIIGNLKRSLIGALTQAMGQGVPAAIAVCHTDAPALAAALASGGVRVGRATRKPRNPSNAVSGWQADALAQFEQAHAAGTPLAGTSFTRRLPDGRVAYGEPLVIQELCLSCHGTSLAPEVQAALTERYPEDRATGYAVGDLRGVAWAELPAR